MGCLCVSYALLFIVEHQDCLAVIYWLNNDGLPLTLQVKWDFYQQNIYVTSSNKVACVYYVKGYMWHSIWSVHGWVIFMRILFQWFIKLYGIKSLKGMMIGWYGMTSEHFNGTVNHSFPNIWLNGFVLIALYYLTTCP